MSDVRELFTKSFAYVLMLERAILQGEHTFSYREVDEQIVTLLYEAAKQYGGILEGDSTDVITSLNKWVKRAPLDVFFPVVVWIDETLLKIPAWPDREAWNRVHLQRRIYENALGGELFFENLKKLDANNPDYQAVREIYFLCLGLGFKGEQREQDRRHFRHDHAKSLTPAVVALQNVSRLTPQPYEAPAPIRQVSRLPALLTYGALAIVLLAVCLYIFLWPTPLTEAMIRQQLGPTPCARVSLQLHNGMVQLKGRVESAAQRSQIRDVMQRIKGVTRIDDTFEIVEKPFCQVLELLEPVRTSGEQHGMQIGLEFEGKQGKNPQEDLPYKLDEFMILHVEAPGQAPSYIYIDFYNEKGVLRIFPDGPDKTVPFQPKSRRKIGPEEPYNWQVEAPFGRELVTIIASKKALNVRPRDRFEPAQPYMDELRPHLSPETGQKDVTALWRFIRTSER